MAGVSHNETFDFIVVGAGSAGSAVTGRLVEAGHKVSQYSDMSFPLFANTGGSDRRPNGGGLGIYLCSSGSNPQGKVDGPLRAF